jgi:hypothetical protein
MDVAVKADSTTWRLRADSGRGWAASLLNLSNATSAGEHRRYVALFDNHGDMPPVANNGPILMTSMNVRMRGFKTPDFDGVRSPWVTGSAFSLRGVWEQMLLNSCGASLATVKPNSVHHPESSTKASKNEEAVRNAKRGRARERPFRAQSCVLPRCRSCKFYDLSTTRRPCAPTLCLSGFARSRPALPL